MPPRRPLPLYLVGRICCVCKEPLVCGRSDAVIQIYAQNYQLYVKILRFKNQEFLLR